MEIYLSLTRPLFTITITNYLNGVSVSMQDAKEAITNVFNTAYGVNEVTVFLYKSIFFWWVDLTLVR